MEQVWRARAGRRGEGKGGAERADGESGRVTHHHYNEGTQREGAMTPLFFTFFFFSFLSLSASLHTHGHGHDLPSKDDGIE